MTGLPIRASECVGPFNIKPVDRHVELHTWVIYRQLAGGNGRLSVAFLRVMNKGYREADFFTPKKQAWMDPSNEFCDFNHCPLRRCYKMECVLEYIDWQPLKHTAGPGWSSLTGWASGSNLCRCFLTPTAPPSQLTSFLMPWDLLAP